MTRVVLRCPRCNGRVEVPYDDWVQSCLPLSAERMRCKNELCHKNILVYHKDVA